MADGSITFSTKLDNRELEKAIKDTERRIESLKQKIEAGDGERSGIAAQLEEAKRAAKDAKEEVERLRESFGGVTAEELAKTVRDSERQIDALTRKLETADFDRSWVERMMEQANGSIDETEQKIAELEAAYEAMGDPDDMSVEQLQEAKAKLEEINQEYGRLAGQRKEQDKLEAKWSALNAKVEEYEQRIQEATSSLEDSGMREQLATLSEAEANLKKQETTHDSLQKKWDQVNEKVEKYKNQLTAAEGKQRELAKELAETSTKGFGAMRGGAEGVASTLDKFTTKINGMLKKMLLFGAVMKGIKAVAKSVSEALMENERFAASWLRLKATVTGIARAIANMVAPALSAMVDAVASAIESLAALIDSVFGTNLVQFVRDARSAAEAEWRGGDEGADESYDDGAADAANEAADATGRQADATRDLADAQQEAKKTMLGFDQINAMQAETAADAADALGDEGDATDGLGGGSGKGAKDSPAPAAQKPSWAQLDVGKISDLLAEVMLILGAALLAVGAILAFSGINIPIGLTLMVIGALMIYAAYQEKWDQLPAQVREAITTALVVAGIVLLVLGAVLAFSGINIPLGIGMMVAGAAMLCTALALNWDSLPAEMQDAINIVGLIVSVALLVVGAILVFTGINVPLGIAMMALGAVGLATLVAVNWDWVRANFDELLPIIEAAIAVFLLLLGACLFFTGVNVPLGLGLMVLGAVGLGMVVAANWEWVQTHFEELLPVIEGVVAGFMLVLGAVLLFTGAHPVAGLGLLVAGAILLGKVIVENWDYIKAKMEEVLPLVEGPLSAAALVLGAILVFTGANVPVGLGLLLAGAIGLEKTLHDNWDKIPDEVKGVIATIELALGGAALVVGAILCFTGVNIPLGLGLIVTGALAMGDSMGPHWDSMPDEVKGVIAIIEAALSVAFLAIGAILCFTAVNIPLGLFLLVLGAAALWHEATMNWDSMPDGVKGIVDKILLIAGAALLVLGIILVFTGVGIPLGIALILAGAAALAAEVAINWDFIQEKVREIWDGVVSFWNTYIAPIFTAEWWADKFKCIVNGLIEMVNNGLDAFGGFANGLTSGISDVLNFFGVDWSPFTISMPQIPYLAQGAVIPPNRKFLAVLGDQPSGNNIEAPEALMRQVVREEAGAMMAQLLLQQGSASSAGGGDITVVLRVDSEDLARSVSRGNASRMRRGEVGLEMAFA